MSAFTFKSTIGPVHIAPVVANHPTLAALVKELDEYQVALYGAENCVVDGPLKMAAKGAIFQGAFLPASDLLIATGALLPYPDYAEIKRLIVHEPYRGFGIGGQLLIALEALAQNLGYSTVFLESGSLQPAAQRLYHKSGYSTIDKFGNYEVNPLSVFFQKQLSK